MKSPLNVKVDLAPFESLALFILTLLGGGAIALAIGLHEGNKAAYAVLGGLVTVGLMALGGAIVLVVMWFAARTERGREARDQEQFQNYSHDQWRVMSEIQRAQNQQNAMLLKQGRELARSLPAPGDDLDIDALVYDGAIFAELGED